MHDAGLEWDLSLRHVPEERHVLLVGRVQRRVCLRFARTFPRMITLDAPCSGDYAAPVSSTRPQLHLLCFY